MTNVHLNPRSALAFLHDIAAAVAAWCLAFWLRFNLAIPEPYLGGMWRSAVWVAPVQAAIFLYFGLYRGLWRYASLPDLKRILLAAVAGAMVVPVALLMAQRSALTPRSVLILYPILLALVMSGSRLAYRAWKEHRLYGIIGDGAKPVLVLGAGDAAVNLIHELGRSREWRVVGLLDDDPTKQKREIHGVRVLGPLDALEQIAAGTGAEHAIVALPSATHEVRRRAVELCGRAGVKALTVPSFDDLMSGRLSVSQLRAVELDDLLGRDPVALDFGGLEEWIKGQTVLVTGAGGSIGSELCRQIARFQPRALVAFEHNEFALYRLEQEFTESFPSLHLVCAIGDIKNATRVEQILDAYRPSVIFHAAAYKHVPLMEGENAWEAVQNNVLGTQVVARAAQQRQVAKFVLVSTDKAVNPTSVMGATKRLAEMVCEALPLSPALSPASGGEGESIGASRFSPEEGESIGGASRFSPEQEERAGASCLGPDDGDAKGTRFVIVRFGNVLGSAGSVIPKFHEQIAKGGPVTVTHPDITRYFMSIPEAAQLVLQAGLMGKGGEIFVLDMGRPVKIVELARDLIRLSGLSEDEIKIAYTGLRPGEKLYEELLADEERTLPTPHPKLRVARARQVDGQWLTALETWLSQPPLSDEVVRRDIRNWLPEYAADNGQR